VRLFFGRRLCHCPLTHSSLFVLITADGSPAARLCIMSAITYYVSLGFVRNEEGELVALDPVESSTSSVAIATARSLAAKNAGAVAFSRTGDLDVGEFTDAKVLWQCGEIP